MPTCIMTAPKNHTPGSYLEAVEDNLSTVNSKGSRRGVRQNPGPRFPVDVWHDFL